MKWIGGKFRMGKMKYSVTQYPLIQHCYAFWEEQGASAQAGSLELSLAKRSISPRQGRKTDFGAVFLLLNTLKIIFYQYQQI